MNMVVSFALIVLLVALVLGGLSLRVNDRNYFAQGVWTKNNGCAIELRGAK